MQKRIFMTGAAGFIGSHLAHHLNDRGDTVFGIDNFNSYYTKQLKFDRMLKLKDKGISIIEGDICDASTLKAAVEEFSPTHIVHLAAQAGVRYSLSNPEIYLKTNVDGFLQILEVCRLYPNLKLTYASSSSVYGLNQKVPFAVSDNTDRQASLYGVTKKTNELMAQTYHHLYGIQVTGLRFFTVYGPWGRPDMAYYGFTKSILDGNPIDIYNNGQMLRDFTYIDDIVSGTSAAIDLEAQCEIFNLGNNHPVPLMDLVHYLEGHLNKKAIKNYLPMQAGDVVATYADIDYSIEKLKFRPTTSLNVGLGKFVDWYKQYNA